MMFFTGIFTERLAIIFRDFYKTREFNDSYMKLFADEQPSREHVVAPYPYWVTQKSGKRVPIVQSFAFSKYFGILTLTLDDKYKIVSAEGNSHLLNYTHEKGKYRKVPLLFDLISQVHQITH